MPYLKKAIATLFLLLAVISINAQQSHVPGEIMVKLDAGRTIDLIENQFPVLKLKKHLSPDWNIFLVKFDPAAVDESLLLHLLKQSSFVAAAQFNHYVGLRGDSLPNDNKFPSMWGLHNNGVNGSVTDADVDAPEAWAITSGGLTTLGDTIVVAVLDGGFYLPHNDLNFWKNYNEIPGNGIDDDGNGYIDDFDGWNASSNSGSIGSNSHGTHVAGTIGAKGNNELGVIGVNANVKVMPVQLTGYTEAEVVAGYNYVFDQRRLYNQTGGAKGAFVVSTNASFGIDYGDPVDYPLWCAVYDSLGTAGILNAGATANKNLDIDVEGDIPTACASPYMISVTNTTSSDVKTTYAGYGKITIDLGAPGTGIWSTYPNNSYNSISGTSMATPHVAGAIALMYSAACPAFINQYKNNPDSMALVVRELMLNNVDVNSSLQNITSSGGRLNLHKSVLAIQQYCNAPLAPSLAVDKTCASDSASFTLTAQAASGSEIYWFNDYFSEPVYTGDTFTVTPGKTSIYYSAAYDSAIGAFSNKVPVKTAVAPVVTVTADTAIYLTYSIQLKATGGGTYSWSPATGLDNAAIASPRATPSVTTTYVVTVTDVDSCQTTGTVTITVLDNTGIDDINNNPVARVYPNPFKSQLTIEFQSDIDVAGADFRLYDLLGKEVEVEPVVSANKLVINRSGLPSGFYLYKFKSGSSREVTGKVTVID